MIPSPPRPSCFPVPEPAWPKPLGFPDHLPDGAAVAEYVIGQCVGDVDEEFVVEFFRDAAATLAWVPLEQIKEGPKDNNIREVQKEKAYSRLSLQTMPPIVIEHGTVLDGNHRYRVARARNAPGLWCYQIEPDSE